MTPPMRPRTATARPPATEPTTEKSRQRKQPRRSLGVHGQYMCWKHRRTEGDVPDGDQEGQDDGEGGATDVQDGTEGTEDELWDYC